MLYCRLAVKKGGARVRLYLIISERATSAALQQVTGNYHGGYWAARPVTVLYRPAIDRHQTQYPEALRVSRFLEGIYDRGIIRSLFHPSISVSFHSHGTMQRHSFTALNSTFVVDSEYQFVKELGQGAYGCVVSAKHRRTGEGCAIKKITNINTKVGGRSLAICLPCPLRYRPG